MTDNERKEVEELALSLAYAMNEGVGDRQRGYARYLINILVLSITLIFSSSRK